MAYRNRAVRYANDLKDYEKAEADYTKAIDLDPENDQNYYQKRAFFIHGLLKIMKKQLLILQRQ